MAGYSGTPLVKKLGIRPGHALCWLDAPEGLAELVGPLPEGARFVELGSEPIDVLHVFLKDRAAMAIGLAGWATKIRSNGAIWVSWPKKSSGVPTTIVEGDVRDVALPIGLVDTKVCAVDEVWSGLRLVWRVDRR